MTSSKRDPYCGAVLTCALPIGHAGPHERSDGLSWRWPSGSNPWILYVTHRLRRHNAYWLGEGRGGACNTCDKDFIG